MKRPSLRIEGGWGKHEGIAYTLGGLEIMKGWEWKIMEHRQWGSVYSGYCVSVDIILA